MSKLTRGKEFERKFWVRVDRLPKALLKAAKLIRIVQGYIALNPDVRVRIANGRAVLEIKGRNDDEFGPMRCRLEEAKKLLRKYRIGILIRKNRFVIGSRFGRLKWELDFFKGANAPLVVAEIETPKKGTKLDRAKFPEFIGAEITGDPEFGPRMGNKRLITSPFVEWPKKLQRRARKHMGLLPR